MDLGLVLQDWSTREQGSRWARAATGVWWLTAQMIHSQETRGGLPEMPAWHCWLMGPAGSALLPSLLVASFELLVTCKLFTLA